MVKNFSKIECKIGTRTYEFTCEIDAPFGEIKEALFCFIKQVGQIEDFAKAQQQNKEAEPKEGIDDVAINNQ